MNKDRLRQDGITLDELLPGTVMRGFFRYSQNLAGRPYDAPHREILEYPEDTTGTIRVRLVCYEQKRGGEAYTVKAEITIPGNDREAVETFVRAWLVG